MLKNIKKIVRKIIKATRFLAMQLARKSIFLTKIYYVFSNEFNNEMKAVMAGKYKHYEDIKNGSNTYFLRRSIHRIEKGLIMKNRKSVFALDYINDTVRNYYNMLTSNQLTKEEINWCNDVLDEYFKITEEHPTINAAYKIYKKILLDYERENNNLSNPYIRSKPDANSIVEYGSLLNLSYYRRSVRWYEQKPVEKIKVDNALQIAAQSPSACNRQPFHYKFFLNGDKKLDILKSAMGTTGYAENVPAVAVVVGELEAYIDERDRHLIYIDSALASMSFLYGLEVQGISSCIINWPDIPSREKKLKNILGLEDNQRVIMLIAFGYADQTERVPYSAKKDISEIGVYY